MNTTENNKLLDNFLQKEGNIISIRNFRGVEIDREYNPNSYHNDWNLLLEVVEKIESLGNHGFTIYRKSTNINGLPIEIANNRADSKIEATYNACIEFVKWWNKEQIE